MNRKQLVLVIAGTLIVGFVLVAAAFRSSKDQKVDQLLDESPDILVRASAKSVGAADAKVHIVEFMDPGCETCAAFHPFVKQLLDENPGKVRLSIRYLPLHEGADTMVKILEAADNQGKYWETLNLMFATQGMWASHHHPEPDKIWPLLPRIGVDVQAIRNDMNAPEIAAMLEQDRAAASALGIRKTPSFFVNGEPLRTFGRDQLRELVEGAIANSY